MQRRSPWGTAVGLDTRDAAFNYDHAPLFHHARNAVRRCVSWCAAADVRTAVGDRVSQRIAIIGEEPRGAALADHVLGVSR